MSPWRQRKSLGGAGTFRASLFAIIIISSYKLVRIMRPVSAIVEYDSSGKYFPHCIKLKA